MLGWSLGGNPVINLLLSRESSYVHNSFFIGFIYDNNVISFDEFETFTIGIILFMWSYSNIRPVLTYVDDSSVK